MSFRERATARNAAQDFNAYFRAMIAKRRSAPRDDIISLLAHAEDGGERLSEREMLNLLRLILIAGNETTANLIGNRRVHTGPMARHRHQPVNFQLTRPGPGNVPRTPLLSNQFSVHGLNLAACPTTLMLGSKLPPCQIGSDEYQIHILRNPGHATFSKYREAGCKRPTTPKL